MNLKTIKGKRITPILVIIMAIFSITALSIVYIHRSNEYTMTINDVSDASGSAAVGFYVGHNSYLPPATSINNSITYGSNKVLVKFSNPVYVSGNDGSTTAITLYARADISATLVPGEWVFDKALYIGLPGDALNGRSVTVVLKVESPSNAKTAIATIYLVNSNGEYPLNGQLDLTNNGDTQSINLAISESGVALYLKMSLTYENSGPDSFVIGVYIAQ